MLPLTLPCLRLLLPVLLGSVGANLSQRVVGRNFEGGDGSLLKAWEARRAPPDAEEGKGRDLLRDGGEVTPNSPTEKITSLRIAIKIYRSPHS